MRMTENYKCRPCNPTVKNPDFFKKCVRCQNFPLHIKTKEEKKCQ